jgi:hypothetical protein
MPEETNPQPAKTLEMRVAELEDKLAKIHFTEEELKAFQKVSSALAATPGAPLAQAPCIAAQAPCVAAQASCIAVQASCIAACIIRPTCVISQCIIRPQCIFECTCGPCVGPTPTVGGAGFGTLGS